jgi:hypothetical protein
VTYRVEFGARAARHLRELSSPTQDALAETLGALVRDPRDPATTLPTGNPQQRWAVFGGATFGGEGFVEFFVRDSPPMIIIIDLVWVSGERD